MSVFTSDVLFKPTRPPDIVIFCVFGNISDLMCGYLNWLVGFESELLVMRWSTSLVTTTDPSLCSSLVFWVNHTSNAQLRVP